ncbi:hypothetical protein DSO57_1007666 [Entomophthora muscae]|uniref:Uncharacterized protein n=1 Tax=Entomophthora muscae TaxID=34485 RepID=A0ACC2T739_9FUNG|nr:hypothetical protein DSO57_1007666 [Entomophthora muscae]
MMCASFLYLILLKTSVEHNMLILTDMGYVVYQQERVAMNSPLVIALKFQISMKEAILWLEENTSLLKQIQMRRLPFTILEIITVHSALENLLVSANVKDDCLFMEHKYLQIANLCSSLQLDSVIVDQGPTGRDYYPELITSHNNKIKNACNGLLYHPAMVLKIRYCRTADKPLLQLSHGHPPDLPCCLFSLMKPRPSVTPEAYLQKLSQVLINTEAEAYHAKLNIKKKDVDHVSNSHPTLPLYKVGDAVYFYSNREYECEKTLVMLWQGPIKANQKMDHVNYTKDLNTGHLITRVHTQYMCAAPSAHE